MKKLYSAIAIILAATIICLSSCSSDKSETNEKNGNHKTKETTASSDSTQDENISVPEQKKFQVLDAVDYTREVVSVLDYDDMSAYHHKIKIPKINVETENGKLFNKTIYDRFSNVYEQLLNYSENNLIYNINYIYKIYKDKVAICVYVLTDIQGSEGWTHYFCYYYDIANDKILSFDEYLTSLGITCDEVFAKIKATKEYKENEYFFTEKSTLTDCLIDEKGTFAIISNILDILEYSVSSISIETGPIV